MLEAIVNKTKSFLGLEKEKDRFIFLNGVRVRDSYDSSHPDYSERYHPNSSKANNFQYRFRERLESRLTNPIEPENYLSAIAANNKETKKFCGEKGFDMNNFVNSDTFVDRVRLGNEKLLRKVVRNMNSDIDQEFVEAVQHVKITNYALNKAKYIAERVGFFSGQVNKDEPEIGMYMLSEPLSVNGKIIIDDIYIAKEQIVQPAYCDITPRGKIMAFRDARQMNKRIAGWAHSHANFSTFFSGEDDLTLKGGSNRPSLAKQWGVQQGFKSNDLIPDDVKMKYFLAIVVNRRGEEPAYRIIAEKPRFYIENGVVKNIVENIDLERTSSEDTNFKNKWPVPEIIEVNKTLDTKLVNKEIIERVSFTDGSRLKDIYKEEASQEIEEPVGIPEQQVEERVVESRQPEESDLTARIGALEKRYTSIEEKLDKIVELVENTQYKKEYEKTLKAKRKLEKENKKLKEEMAYINMPIDKKLSYTTNLKNFYTKLENSSSHDEKILGLAAKIISGDYYGNLDKIKKGDYDSGGKRIWKWEDRVKAVNTLYKNNKKAFSNMNGGLTRRLYEIMESNKYLKKNYSSEIDKIKKILK